MKKATYLREWPGINNKRLERAIIVEVEEPIVFLGLEGPDESRFLCVIATRFSAAHVPGRDRASVYHVDSDGRPLSIIPLAEKHDTLSLREVMTEAGYDVSSWPEEIE